MKSICALRIAPPRLDKLVDLAALLGLAIVATAVSVWGLSHFDDAFYRMPNYDLFFQADSPRVFDNMTHFGSEFRARDSVHPLFSLLAYPITKVIRLLGLQPLAATKTLVALAAGSSVALFYLALRHLTLPVHAAAIFAALFISSTTFVYWFSVVETYAFAALSICLMLMVLSRARTAPSIVWVLASAGTLSITVTNWSMGLAAAFFRLPFLRFVSISAAALGLAIALALVQGVVFPTSKLFFSPGAVSNELKFAQFAQEQSGKDRWNPLDNLQSFFIYGAVAPGHTRTRSFPVAAVTNVGLPLSEVLKSRGLPIALWLSLLVAGAWGIANNRKLWPAGGALGAFIAGQAALHSFYGEVTFLYAAHFFPALLGVAACAYFAPARRLWLAAALLLLVVGGAGNIQQFKAAATDVNAVLR